MSDEKKTINVDGLSDESIKAFQESVDACRNGKGIWILDDGSYDRRMKKSFDNGSVATCMAAAIVSTCMAIYIANEDKIKDDLSRAMKLIFGKRKK